MKGDAMLSFGGRKPYRGQRRVVWERALWLCGLILGVTGCASPQVVIENLPLDPRAPGADRVIEVSLQETGVSGKDERIFSAWVSLKNRTGKTLSVGPQHVHLADAAGMLLPRVSERWLSQYYEARIRGLPVEPARKAIAPFPSAEFKMGDVGYRATALSPAEKKRMAEELAKLVDVAFVRPQQEAPGAFFDKGPEVTFGVFLKEMTLRPGRGISGYVYFYHSKANALRYPLRLVIRLQDTAHAFLFREP